MEQGREPFVSLCPQVGSVAGAQCGSSWVSASFTHMSAASCRVGGVWPVPRGSWWDGKFLLHTVSRPPAGQPGCIFAGVQHGAVCTAFDAWALGRHEGAQASGENALHPLA